jgi:hypothetical protein
MSKQFGEYNWLEYIVETVGSFDVCGQMFVQVTARVVGVPDTSLTRIGFMYATAVRTVPVPEYRKYETRGDHFTSGWIPYPGALPTISWWPTGTTVSEADIRPPQLVYESPDTEGCPPADTESPYFKHGDLLRCSSPIIVDTARDGYDLTDVKRGVAFDLDADGNAEQVAWTRAGSDDAFLAMDRNGNGRIDDGSELFGDHTPADAPDRFTPNGFEALAFFHHPAYGPSLPDGQINAQDAAFARLLLWRDVNHNGISEPDELTSAAAAGVVSIGTDYKEKRRVDRFGNQFRQKGQIAWTDGATEPVFDIWLLSRQ